MDLTLICWSATTLLSVVVLGWNICLGMRRIERLDSGSDVALQPGDPTVSIIVPARNEQRDIEEALTALLNLDYPGLEIIVINDRSTDNTGDILSKMAARFPDLQVISVTELPDGWLGKNHALYRGAQQAKGELLLFTDADVVMHASTLRRAVRYFTDHQLDHLAMTPIVQMPTAFMEAFVVTFTIFFSAYFRPWKTREPDSEAHVGIGAFNLIRAISYREVGTHEAIRMRPDDDVKLGKLVKLNQKKQDVVHGLGLINVRWYHSLAELVEGLMKNAFSGAEYRLGLTTFASLFALVFLVWPFVAVFVTTGAAQWLYGATVVVLLLVFVDAACWINARWWLAPLFPIGTLLFVYIQWRAVYLTYRTGGIEWRGTHYPLAELRANKI